MLHDKDILPICRRYARSFIKQARHLGEPNDVFDELFNVAYTAAKPLNELKGTATWIMWALIKHTKIDNKALYEKRLIEHPVQSRPDNKAIRAEERQILIKAIAKLNPTERALVYCRYRDNMTFRAIGKELGFSGCWASKLIKGIIDKLRAEVK